MLKLHAFTTDNAFYGCKRDLKFPKNALRNLDMAPNFYFARTKINFCLKKIKDLIIEYYSDNWEFI